MDEEDDGPVTKMSWITRVLVNTEIKCGDILIVTGIIIYKLIYFFYINEDSYSKKSPQSTAPTDMKNMFLAAYHIQCERFPETPLLKPTSHRMEEIQA